MSTQANPLYTPDEYLELERAAPYKSEYISGEIFAMAGASERHNTLTLNIGRDLSSQMRGRDCRAFVSDMRVKVSSTGLYTYPDAVAVCGERRFDGEHHDTLVNPSVIIEVLSPSTELYDRGEKFAHYQRLGSLIDYLLVAQDKCRVEHYTRQTDEGGQWLLSVVEDQNDVIQISSIECALSLAGIYENVDI